MQKPSIGRIVHVIVDPAKNNGTDIAPAIITRVWSETPDSWCVNYKIFYDGEAAPGYTTSAYLFENEEAARTSAEPAIPGSRAFWPARV
ncbi:hypothetical protein OIE13_06025 [Streptosporangium sp. NBC_01810]|uniref:hypothetical protein n=1 Tax=Streptosporangium sp. NBC_01810 TaxID=2975951 RepID=UPI002DDC3104|nr:hypothetical protein [Streptosporangium sp. NBC_01810]WSA27431.1 hypothetical protein OIE13_06025 [Streptosporangium sp. NBC_01810]